MKTKILGGALLLGILGFGQSGSLEGAWPGGTPFYWIGRLPDLYVTSHVKIDWGPYVAVGFNVKNQGLSASGPFKVSVISLSPTSPSSFDIPYSSLGAGQSSFKWILVSKATTPPGTPHLLAVDSDFDVGESNEGNNLHAFSAP